VKRGADTSVVQPVLTSHQWRATGLDFVYVRCGNGNAPPDPNFVPQMTNARTAELVAGFLIGIALASPLLTCAGCTPAPASPPAPDASDASVNDDAARACAKLVPELLEAQLADDRRIPPDEPTGILPPDDDQEDDAP